MYTVCVCVLHASTATLLFVHKKYSVLCRAVLCPASDANGLLKERKEGRIQIASFDPVNLKVLYCAVHFNSVDVGIDLYQL